MSKTKVLEQYNTVKGLADIVSYSFKTNPDVGAFLEEDTDCMFTVHFINSLEKIKDRSRVWMLGLALDDEGIGKILSMGVHSFIIENRQDLDALMDYVHANNTTIDIMLRMKMKEHTLKTEKHYVYGMYSSEINEIIPTLSKDKNINKVGVHFHRKTQNISEWGIKDELEELLRPSTLDSIELLDIGGGIPVRYKNYSDATLPYVMDKIKEMKEWANSRNIKLIVEPGRFIAAPGIELHSRAISVSQGTVFINCSVYNSAMDTIVDNVKLEVKGELDSGKRYLIKGCTPDSRDIFRYSVYMKGMSVGDEVIFENAGAYTYSTDFCGLTPLEMVVVD